MKIRRRTALQLMLAATSSIAAPAVLRAQNTPFRLGLLTVKTVRSRKVVSRWNRGP